MTSTSTKPDQVILVSGYLVFTNVNYHGMDVQYQRYTFLQTKTAD